MSDADPLRLSPATLPSLPPDSGRAAYDRGAQRSGIVHFGIGAFHRAHQAAYTDDAMAAGDRDWAITGISLRSQAVSDQLSPQDGLYSLHERSDAGDRVRIVGSVRRALVAPDSPEAVVAAIASPDTRILSFTVTEKGYHRTVQGTLDLSDPSVAADLADNGTPSTIYGFLRAGLARRRAAGLAGVTLLSCDNLSGNGVVLGTCVQAFLNGADPSIARWFEAECTSPSTMVDRIVPATTAADRDRVTALLGVRDEGAVLTEPFRQWVIEDRFVGPRPRWEAGGAIFAKDVHVHEIAKLRLLNGAHSALAYLGRLAGHEFVHEAIADPTIRRIVEQLMQAEAATTLPDTADANWMRYCVDLTTRFENRQLRHSLAQIAEDGSQKISQRWLAPLADGARSDRSFPATLTALAAWIVYVRGDRFKVADPMADRLADLWESAGADAIAGALFGPGGMFANSWTASAGDLANLTENVKALVGGPR